MSRSEAVDWDKSEHGPQRRKTASGRLLHACCICGLLDVWGDSWSTFCSIREMDDEVPIAKFCSQHCRNKGGKDAALVTDEMKRRAKDAEWREPRLAYRPLTDKEKYRDAVHTQQTGAKP